MEGPIHLRAIVRRPTGATQHYLAVGGDAPNGLEAMPVASIVEIIEDPGGFMLYRYSDTGKFAGDSWFETVAECKRQALFEFEIEDADWSLVEDAESK